ncbi:MAG: hypothetical protein IJ995_04380 [Clostridia bacterium]|nr:hypothetical protein [Clostridia bacterium]
MTAFQKLDQLTALAKADPALRQALLATAQSDDAIWDFCQIAQKAGVELYAGELFALGEEYCDNQCKSTNGGNPSPYYSFNDAYENFIESIK